jgi:hypothetical protein
MYLFMLVIPARVRKKKYPEQKGLEMWLKWEITCFPRPKL